MISWDDLSKVSKRHFALAALMLAFAISLFVPTQAARAQASCSVPNQITNGQVADANVVMGNFNALRDCANSVSNAAVMPSGNPAAGNLPVFSSTKSITNGDLSGDCTTAGSLAVTCTKTNGTPLGYYATGTDAGQLTGTVSPQRFANGVNADNLHFLRGDGVWAVPTGTGGGGSGSTATMPSIRASSMASFNAGSVTIPWPAGTVAGDVVVIFVSDGWAVNSPSSGWTILNNTGGSDYANGLTVAKSLTRNYHD